MSLLDIKCQHSPIHYVIVSLSLYGSLCAPPIPNQSLRDGFTSNPSSKVSANDVTFFASVSFVVVVVDFDFGLKKMTSKRLSLSLLFGFWQITWTTEDTMLKLKNTNKLFCLNHKDLKDYLALHLKFESHFDDLSFNLNVVKVLSTETLLCTNSKSIHKIFSVHET